MIVSEMLFMFSNHYGIPIGLNTKVRLPIHSYSAQFDMKQKCNPLRVYHTGSITNNTIYLCLLYIYMLTSICVIRQFVN